MLEFPDVVAGERRVDGRAEPGIEAIDRPVACGEFLDHRTGTAEALCDRGCEDNARPAPCDRDDVRNADAVSERDRRQRSTPFALRKSAATRRGSFLSTSTWRLSSCMVGLSIRLPTLSSASTALALPATVSSRTTGAR